MHYSRDLQYFLVVVLIMKVECANQYVFCRERSMEVLYDGDGDENSIATLILDSLLQCPIDCRATLASNILVIGNSVLLARP